jgi:hypothetical protein
MSSFGRGSSRTFALTDAELLRAAIVASGITDPRTGEPSTRGFALRVLGMNDGSARDVLADGRRLVPLQRIVCAAIVARPRLARELERANSSLPE